MAEAKTQFVDDTHYPPSASLGGNNAYYLDYCESGGCKPGYAVCLHKVKAVQEGRLHAELGSCTTRIQSRTCPAMGLRDKELLEGRALYFIDRQKQLAWWNEQVKLPVTSPFLDELKEASKATRKAAATKKAGPAPAAPTYAPVVDAGGGYAAAINAAMQETQPAPVAAKPTEPPKPVEPPKAQPIATPSLKPAPGESMLEFAKRMREARAAA
jgi:hypothetical protein